MVYRKGSKRSTNNTGNCEPETSAGNMILSYLPGVHLLTERRLGRTYSEDNEPSKQEYKRRVQCGEKAVCRKLLGQKANVPEPRNDAGD